LNRSLMPGTNSWLGGAPTSQGATRVLDVVIRLCARYIAYKQDLAGLKTPVKLI